MMRAKHLIALFFALNMANAAESCPTVQSCQIGTACECVVTPSSAYDRKFSLNFSGVKQGEKYVCDFSSSPPTLLLVLAESIFPQGVTYQCVGSNCPHFPLKLLIDASGMSDAEGKFLIKYFVPGSDTPTHLVVRCSIAS